jgi:hypothetical protein
VGYATAAFVLAVLEGSTQPGVWFPEEVSGALMGGQNNTLVDTIYCFNFLKSPLLFIMQPEGVAIESRKVLLERASQGTTIFVMNKPSWMIETDPKEVGLGIYV